MLNWFRRLTPGRALLMAFAWPCAVILYLGLSLFATISQARAEQRNIPDGASLAIGFGVDLPLMLTFLFLPTAIVLVLWALLRNPGRDPDTRSS